MKWLLFYVTLTAQGLDIERGDEVLHPPSNFSFCVWKIEAYNDIMATPGHWAVCIREDQVPRWA